MAELHEILLRPIVTEKSMTLAETENSYLFEVGVGANKIQIRQAVEEVFGVRVESVRTLNYRGKNKRFGRHYGKRSNWKKAYVKLAEGNTLDFFEA
jgi:large subunit ribosomal protein L23